MPVMTRMWRRYSMSTLLLAPSQLDFSSGFSKNYLIKPFEDILPAKKVEPDIETVGKGHFRNLVM